MLSRKTVQVLKVIVLTSLVWCMLDVWILTYYSGCADTPVQVQHRQDVDDVEDSDEFKSTSTSKSKSLLDKVLDKVPEGKYLVNDINHSTLNRFSICYRLFARVCPLGTSVMVRLLHTYVC